MSAKKKVCIVGGGATGAALLWALAQDPEASQQWDITLIHNQDAVGGHSMTFTTVRNGETLYIDIGVQFISPLLYPNLRVMLQMPDFQSVEVRDYNELKIACAFPRDANNNMQNWGNFPAYQTGPQFSMLYNSDMQHDIEQFQALIEVAAAIHWGSKSLQDFFTSPPPSIQLNNSFQFQNFLVDPYMSIINGYGAALLRQTLFYEMIPLFGKLPLPKTWGLPTPLGSFTTPGVGWQRFAKGAQSWVQAMADVALKSAPSTRFIFNSLATAVWTDQNTGQVTVQWQDQNGNSVSDVFDKVVLTTDMWTNSKLLNNPNNQYFWNNLYEKYVGYRPEDNQQPVVWDLMYGACYVHTDENILSPDLRNQQETNQFTAYYAAIKDPPGYDLLNTYTTYIQKNVLGTPSNPDINADGIYLTMYGYVPQGDQKVPDKSTWLTDPIIWTHGNWTPAAMGDAKSTLHLAQGLGNISYPGQMNTNVYFAGNNTTVDSEEGALISAMAIANYAFDVNYPLRWHLKETGELIYAFAMYELYHHVMFPKDNPSHAIAALHQMLPDKDSMQLMTSPLMAKPQSKLSAVSKKVTASSRNKSTAKIAKPGKKLRKLPNGKSSRTAKKTNAKKVKTR